MNLSIKGLRDQSKNQTFIRSLRGPETVINEVICRSKDERKDIFTDESDFSVNKHGRQDWSTLLLIFCICFPPVFRFSETLWITYTVKLGLQMDWLEMWGWLHGWASWCGQRCFLAAGESRVGWEQQSSEGVTKVFPALRCLLLESDLAAQYVHKDH